MSGPFTLAPLPPAQFLVVRHLPPTASVAHQAPPSAARLARTGCRPRQQLAAPRALLAPTRALLLRRVRLVLLDFIRVLLVLVCVLLVLLGPLQTQAAARALSPAAGPQRQ